MAISVRESTGHPLCPHCEAPLNQVGRSLVEGAMGKSYLWSCGECRKALGVTMRTGFWMG